MNMQNQNNFKKWKLMFIPLIILGITALGALVMYLWNWLMPEIFGLPLLTFWQALGLLVLSKILFGGFKMNKNGGSKREFSNSEFKQKFMNMSEEERAEFKEKWKQRCGK